MITKRQELQGMIRLYKQETGVTEVDMMEVAKYAVKRGWQLPQPESPFEKLKRQLTDAARDEVRYDEATGLPYRANHAIVQKQGDTQLHLWIDIDEAPRGLMRKSLVMRREQIVNDGLQLTLDADHWNSIHPSEEPIQMPMDFEFDIELRKNAPREMQKAS